MLCSQSHGVDSTYLYLLHSKYHVHMYKYVPKMRTCPRADTCLRVRRDFHFPLYLIGEMRQRSVSRVVRKNEREREERGELLCVVAEGFFLGFFLISVF